MRRSRSYQPPNEALDATVMAIAARAALRPNFEQIEVRLRASRSGKIHFLPQFASSKKAK